MPDSEKTRRDLQEALNTLMPIYEDTFYEAELKLYERVLASLGRFNPSYFLDLDRDGFEALHTSTQSPVVFSYERVTPQICVLWDTDHELSISIKFMERLQGKSFKEANGLLPPFRPHIFRDALKKTNSEEGPVRNLAIELSCDRGQYILDSCASGRITFQEATDALAREYESPAAPDSYSDLLFYAVRNEIRLHAIDAESGSLLYHDDELHAHAIERDKKYFAPNLKRISQAGKTFAVIGGGHRKNLLELLRAP